MATTVELSRRHISGKTLRLTDAAVNGIVAAKTFDDCIIYGPVVIAPQGMTTMREPHFHGTRGDIIYDFGDMKTRTGMLIVADCTFNTCTFYDVGVAQPRDFLKTMTIIGEVGPSTNTVNPAIEK